MHLEDSGENVNIGGEYYPCSKGNDNITEREHHSFIDVYICHSRIHDSRNITEEMVDLAVIAKSEMERNRCKKKPPNDDKKSLTSLMDKGEDSKWQ